MLGLLINLIIIVLVLGVAWWIIGLIPLPPPFPTIVLVLFVLIALALAIDMLAGIAGGSGGFPVLRHW